MESDDLLSRVKMEEPDTQQYRLIDGRLVAIDTDTGIMEHFSVSDDADLGLSSQQDVLHSVYSEVNEDVNSADLEEDASNTENNDVLVQLMDIRTSLSRLRSILEHRIGMDLTEYEFWLQDSKKLDINKTLVDQCINRAGLVQVNIQIRPNRRRINIVDVLKPDEEFLHQVSKQQLKEDQFALINSSELQAELPIENEDPLSLEGLIHQEEEEDVMGENSGETKEGIKATIMAKWIVDPQFKDDQKRLKIPEDPKFWTVPQVRHWIQWAVRQFNLTGIKLTDWTISGKELCDLCLQDFRTKCPSDPGDLFWTHLELLRKCKFIAVVQNDELSDSLDSADRVSNSPSAIRKKPKVAPVVMEGKMSQPISLMSSAISRSGNNGQIQLWQFLLELLTSTEHTSVIQWIGTNGEFKLQEPEMVAKLWGLRKHKPTMNYEKLSRALRYYYDGDMISKVHGKRFVYRFVCDLKQLIGYDAGDLARLVNKDALRQDQDDSNAFQTFC